MDPDAPAVSDEEMTWLRRLSQGVTIADRAREVEHSEREMYRLLAALYARMGVHGKTEALVRATQWGLIPPRPERS